MSKWKSVKVGDIVITNPKVPIQKGKVHAYIPMEEITLHSRYVYQRQCREYRGGARFENKDVLFARITPCLQNKKIAQFISSKSEAGFGSTEYFVFRAKKQISDPSFIFYLLKSDYIVDIAVKSMTGASGRQRADINSILDIDISVPSIEEQVVIGKVLSAYDDLIENNTRRIAILEAMAQRLYREWFVHFRFPGHEKVKMVESEMGAIPKGWEVIQISDNIKPIRQTVRRSELSDEMTYVGIEHIPRKKMIINEYATASVVKSDKLLFSTDDVLFGKIRAYFHKVAIAPFDGCCSTDVIVLRLSTARYAYDYLALFSDEFIAFATQISQGTKMPRAEWSVLKDYKCISPTQTIIDQFNRIVCPVIAQMQLLVKKNAILRKTRDLLLPQLISGRLDVSELNIKVA